MPLQSQRVYPFSNLVLEESGWSAPCPGCFPPGKEFQYPLQRRLGRPQGWYELIGRRENLLSPPGFEPWTIQSVASCCIDSAVPAPKI